MSAPASVPNVQPETNRLHFLYKVIEDTQATIRFLDTKAAFCVTLLSGMAAVAIQRPHGNTTAAHIALAAFLAIDILSLLVCLRVIFPTIKPSANLTTPATPRFYIGQNKAHHWLLHTIANPIDSVLSETHATYTAALDHATDRDLMASLTETVLMTALIRQLKSDRLHAAMFCLGVSVLLFATAIFG